MVVDDAMLNNITNTFKSIDKEVIGVKDVMFSGYVRAILKNGSSNEDKLNDILRINYAYEQSE